MCEIKKYTEIENFHDLLKKYNNSQCNSNKKNLAKWFRNAAPDSDKFHFLPKISMFEGGFVDFRTLISVEYDKEKGELVDKTYEKLGVITEHFKKNIISRFSTYYHRQGQPEFNEDSVLEKLIKD